jgi:2'-5' RNA ligase
VLPLPEKIRAFVALRLSAESAAMVANFIDELRGSGAGIRWTRAANLHLTLRFLGDAVAAATIPALATALDKIGNTTEPFPLLAQGTGAFPDLTRPRIIWIGLRSDRLIRLAERVEAAARECGFPPDDRPFVPHLTIGRVRDRRRWGGLRDAIAAGAQRDFGHSPIDSMVLYRSILGRESPTYEAIAQFPFSA